MAQVQKTTGDVQITGTLTVGAMVPVANSVNDASVQTPATPSQAISASKIQSAMRWVYSQGNTAATSITIVLGRIFGATAAVQAFLVGCIGAATSPDTVTVDLKKNGTTILTTPVSLTSATAAYGSIAAMLAAAAATLVAGDVLTAVITANHSSGSLPTGLFCEAVVWEDPN